MDGKIYLPARRLPYACLSLLILRQRPGAGNINPSANGGRVADTARPRARYPTRRLGGPSEPLTAGGACGASAPRGRNGFARTPE